MSNGPAARYFPFANSVRGLDCSYFTFIIDKSVMFIDQIETGVLWTCFTSEYESLCLPIDLKESLRSL